MAQRSRTGLALLAWLLAAPLAFAQAPAKSAPPSAAAAKPSVAGPVRVASVEGITEYRLANGLRVLLFPDPTKPTITVNITYLVGSRHENYGETGMAHLLEHMLFKGTQKHPEFNQELVAHGAQSNGSTWYDRTNYYETFQATDENLKWALELEADRMVNAFVRKKDLDSEMTVVRNEFEAGENDPASDPPGACHLDRIPLAQLRQVDDRREERPRERADRSPPGVLPDVLPARQRRAPDRRAFRRGEDASRWCSRPSARSRSPRASSPRSTRSTRRRTASVRSSLERVGDVQALAAAYHIPSGASPGFRRRSRFSSACSPIRPAAASKRPSSTRRRRPRSAATPWTSTIPVT